MEIKIRKLKLAPIILVVVLTSSCATQSTTNPAALTPLQKVATALVEYSKSIALVQTAVIQGNKSGFISTDATRTFIEFCVKGNQIGQEASRVTRSVNTLSPTDGTKILNILNPVISSIGNLITQGTVGIKDAKTKDTIVSALLAVQSTLNLIQLTIAGGA